MRAFIYQAALWCEDCGWAIRARLEKEIKIPVHDFLKQVGDLEEWKENRGSWARELIREKHGIPMHAKKVWPPGFDPEDETTFDSDQYPKGPYCNGGGESDCPNHCDGCKVFLENPLTQDGENYVREQADKGHIPDEWREFYDYLLE